MDQLLHHLSALLAHVRGAQEIWLSRLAARPATIAVWPEFSVQDLATVGTTVDDGLRAFFAALGSARLSEPLRYKNSTGETFHTPIGDVLLNLMTHGQYHRGKANAALRAAGVEPAGVDYIRWQRELQASSR